MQPTGTPPTTVRHDGWTDARKAQFLEALAGHGEVRAACGAVGLSREAAYCLRRRDPLFARAWAAAQVLSREVGAEVLACRALDGVEEEVWYRGEMLGMRRRYDSRLLLAHLARLDAVAEDEAARADAKRFDELVALVGGATPSEDLPCDDDGLPRGLAECIGLAGKIADDEAVDEMADADGEKRADEPPSPFIRRFQAQADAAAVWQAWVCQARTHVERLLTERPQDRATPARLSASTLSGVSSSALGHALAAEWSPPGKVCGAATPGEGAPEVDRTDRTA